VTSAALTDTQVSEVAAQLAAASAQIAPVDQLVHEPASVDDGYRIQAAVLRLLDDRPVGWKAGCTNEAAQRMLQVDRPLVGRYPSALVVASPAALRAADFVATPHIEVEVGLRMIHDLSDVPRDVLDLADAVEAFAAIEIVDGRMASFPLLGAAQLAADNVLAGRMIVGEKLDLDPNGLRTLDTVPVELIVDGQPAASATGAAALGHPLRVLQFVAEHAIQLGDPIRAGDLVITGTCTGLVPARLGLDHLGRVGGADVRVRLD
jgi:2-keto-4-pentenoate hydratase